MAKNDKQNQARIDKIDITDEKISGRGGITFFLRYVENSGFYQILSGYFGILKKSEKGLSLLQFIKQILAFFIDGTDMSISGFDRKKDDEGYAAVLENTPEEMASSHQIKRFFAKFALVNNFLFRKVLKVLFIWRLLQERPVKIILQADTMVMDNNDADKREGNEPTYKKRKGFQPLHITWGSYLIDVVFRSGSKHSNHGNDFIKAIGKVVKTIRKYYKDVPIIVNTDGGFLSDANFRYFEDKLKINFVCTGKLYDYLKEDIIQMWKEEFQVYEKNKQTWNYIEFGNRLKSWERFRRCLYTTLNTDETGQVLLEFVRPDNIIYTNLGQNAELDNKLIEAGGANYLDSKGIIELSHSRGGDELIHRSLKELATKEQLPFEKMYMNRAYYYFLVFSHFLFESYKRDVLKDVISPMSYPNTVRRKLIDFAVKVIRHGGQIILKISRSVYKNLKLEELWVLCQSPPRIINC